MSVQDRDLKFSDAQAMAASSAAVTQSTDVVDTTEGKTIKNAWGTSIDNQIGNAVWNLAVTGAINATTVITAKLMTHSAATSIKSGTEIAEIVLPAAAAAGTRRSVKFNPGQDVAERYLGVTYTVSGAKCTAGNIESWLGADAEVPG
jgi:hypothetical protein